MILSTDSKHNIIKYCEFLVYISIILLAVSDSGIQLLILHKIGPYSRTLRLIAMSLLFTKVLFTRFTKKEFFLLLPLAVLSLYNYTLCGNIYCVYNVLIIASLKDVDLFRLFRCLFYSTLFTVCLMAILSFFEISGPVKLIKDFGRGGLETRYCFGLYHPNIWHQAVARCIVFFCIGYYESLNIGYMITLFVLNYGFYKLSISRTGFITVSLFLVLLFFYKYCKKLMHCLWMKICIFMGMLGIYGIFLYFLYDFVNNSSILSQRFNDLTTGRLQLAHRFLKEHPILLFGSRFPDDGTVFDCGFIRIFYESGYLLAGIFFFAFFVMIFYSLKKQIDLLIPVSVFFVFYSIYEIDPVTRPTYNVIIYFFAFWLYETTTFLKEHKKT